MRKYNKITKLSLMVGASLASSAFNTNATEVTSMSVQSQTANGVPSFVVGELGSMTQNTAAQALKNIIASQNEYAATGNENFKVRRQWTDELGKTHTHFDQTINGIKVYGTSMIMHANSSVGVLSTGNSQADIYGITGNLAKSETSAL